MSVHTEPGSIFGNVISQPEIFPKRNALTQLMCQRFSLERQHQDHLDYAESNNKIVFRL